MRIQEIAEAECREVLAGENVAHLACALNNQPYVVPTRVDLEGEFLYGYATLGQKIEWMRQNPLVCLGVDELTSHGDWVSVIVLGRYEELPHTPQYEDERRTAERLFQRHAMWWEPAGVPLAHREQRMPVVFRIRMDRVTGRRATSGGAEGTHGSSPPKSSRPRGFAAIVRRLTGRS
jgi:nitroimidazol reductase NimA-like FMN-containing flavoprotein (pyridoxamine 5'-phosphate oxidase superfamily)